MGGFAPKSAKIKLMEGVAPSRINMDEPVGEPLVISTKPPSHLSADARRCWRRIVPVLAKMGTLAQCDADILCLYCTTWARHVQAEQKLQDADKGDIILGLNGAWHASPWLKVSTEAIRLLHKLGSDLGLNPAARSRIHAEHTPTDEEVLDQFIAGVPIREAGEPIREKKA